MKLSKEEIKSIIPHRDPMLLVDTVEEMVPGDHIVTTFFIDPDREIFRGHFPGEPVLPGVYSVECMAQSADILLLSMERYAGKVPLFLGINNVRFLRKILPGDTIEIHARLASERAEKAIATCSAEIFRGHFPGEPVLPGVYSVECMAQTADILLLSMERYAGKVPLFLGINNVRFLRKILPGDTIEIRARLAGERAEKAIATCSAEVYDHGELAATGDVTLAMR